MNRPPLILASSSPRRRQLLEEAGYEFTVLPPRDIREDALPNESPEALVRRLAVAKAKAVAGQVSAGGEFGASAPLILGCDTVAQCGGEILGKPNDREDARRMLKLLRGSEHRVVSGLCLWQLPAGGHRVEIDVTRLIMDRLSDGQIEDYLDTNQWEGKAGAFGYQDGLDWVHIVEGSESNVVGLPMELLAGMLAARPGKGRPSP